MKVKHLLVVLVWAGVLFGFEDVSFSARTLGLGGDHAALSDDAFSHIVNPALPARWQRPVVALTVPYGGIFNTTFTYVQPVRGLGCIGGSLFYREIMGVTFGDNLIEADGRFFLAVPIGRFFSFGASLGAVSQVYFSGTGEYPLPLKRLEPGPILAVSGAFSSPIGISAGVSFSEWWLGRGPLLQCGLSWKSTLKKGFLSSYLVAANVEVKDNVLKLHGGGEVFVLKDIVGLRAGFRYGSDSLSGFSPTLGLTLRTHRVEKTDFELHYGLNVDELSPHHQLSLVVLFGDARKVEKDSIMAAQAERARRLREEALERERDRLKAELAEIENERAALERQREDIERLRREAFDRLSRMNGLNMADEDSLIHITIAETALRFEEGSAEIPFTQGYKVLAAIAEFLLNYSNSSLLIEVHTDNTEIPEEVLSQYLNNRTLSEARARNINRYFTEVEGLASSRVSARGKGSGEPMGDNETEEGRAINRRVEVYISK